MPFQHEALGNEIAELSAHLNAAKSRLIALIGEFDASEGWGDEGCLTCAHWLNWKCGVSPQAAREQVRVARALKSLPEIRDAFSSGRLSYSKVRAMTRVATPDNEAYLLMLAEHGTAAHIETVVRGVRRCREQRELEAANESHDARNLQWWWDHHGMLAVQVRLDAEQGARFIASVEREMRVVQRELKDNASAEARGEHEPARTTFGAMRADSLLRLIDGDNPDTEIIVHVSAEALAGEPAREPSRAGRDEGHHVHHWSHGGETSMANLVSLCRHHHRLVHEGGFGVEASAHGMFRFLRPDGREIAATLPRVAVDGNAFDSIVAGNRALGLAIDADTGVTLWDGVPMDASEAVEGVLVAGGEYEF